MGGEYQLRTVTSRTTVDARVFVTERMTPLHIETVCVHQVSMPYRWRSTGLVELTS